MRILNIFLALAFALLPLFIDPSIRQFWPAYFALGALVWLVISEQIFEAKERKVEFSTIVSGFERNISDASSIILFNDSLSAREYIKANASLARSIYNTRIGSSNFDETDQILQKTKTAQDDAIKKAIENGTSYHIVYDESYASQKGQLEEWWNKISMNASTGRLTTKIVKAADIPLIQFTVLCYRGRKEVLVGWVVSDNRAITQEIFLVRSDAMAEYFIKLFLLYEGLR